MFSDWKTIFSLCLLVVLSGFTGLQQVKSQSGPKGEKGKYFETK